MLRNFMMLFRKLQIKDPDLNFSSEEEKNVGNDIISKIGEDFVELKEDTGFVLVFFGKDIQKLKFYKKTEFGSAYTIDFEQKGVTIQAQFQIKAKEANADEFHDIISKIVEKRTGTGFLQFLEQ